MNAETYSVLDTLEELVKPITKSNVKLLGEYENSDYKKCLCRMKEAKHFSMTLAEYVMMRIEGELQVDHLLGSISDDTVYG